VCGGMVGAHVQVHFFAFSHDFYTRLSLRNLKSLFEKTDYHVKTESLLYV